MENMPLHPAIVHIPLGIALILPIVAVGLTIAIWKNFLPSRAWALMAGLQLVILVGGLLAINSGEAEEERVEAVVPEERLETHESYADQFIWSAGVVLALSLSVFAFRTPNGVRAMTLLSTLGTVVVFGLALRVGGAGGELVYVHGAASAYVTQPGSRGGGEQENEAAQGMDRASHSLERARESEAWEHESEEDE